MLKTTSSYWADEIRRAEEYVEPFIRGYEEEVRKFAGPGFKDEPGELHNPENHAAEFIALTIGKVAAANPRLRIKSTRAEVHAYARGLQYAGNRWAREHEVWELEERLYVDYSLRHCITYTTMGPRPGFEGWGDPPMAPRLGRVDPRCFGWDPAASRFDECWYAFHLEAGIRSAMLRHAEEHQDEGWIVKNIEAAGADVGFDKVAREPGEVPHRDEIVYYVIHVREWDWGGDANKYTPEKGYNGAVLTLAYSIDSEGESPEEDGDELEPGTGMWLREPQPFFGPPQGPYAFEGYLPVPNEVAKVSPVALVAEQTESLNRHVRLMLEMMADYKLMALVSDMDPDLIELIKDGKNRGVYPAAIEGLRENVVSFAVGGITELHVQWAQLERERLARNSGLHDIQRGMVGTADTATEATLATSAGDARTQRHVDKFRKFMERSFRNVLWYLWADERSEQVMEPQGSGAFIDLDTGEQMMAPALKGGPGPGESMEDVLRDFYGMDIEIERYSMSMTDMQRQSFLLAAMRESIAELVVLCEEHPWVRVEEYAASKAELLGIPELERLFDWEKGRQFGLTKMQLQIDAAARDMGQDGSSPQPRLGGDRGGSMGGKAQTKPIGQGSSQRAGSAAGRSGGATSATAAGKASVGSSMANGHSARSSATGVKV